MPRITVFHCLLALALPAVATARAPIVDSNPVAEAVARAVHYWGGTPCDGSVAVTAGPSGEAPPAGTNAPSPAGDRAAMWSTWLTPAGANQFDAAGQQIPPVTFIDCVIHINSSVWPSWRTDDGDFPAFCKEMLHEYGHLEGYPDVGAAPDTIQYERPDLAHVPLCERYRLVYGRKIYRPTRKTRRRHRHTARGARTAGSRGLR